MKKSAYIEWPKSEDDSVMEHCLAAEIGFKWNKYNVFGFDEKHMCNPRAFDAPHPECPVVGSVQSIRGYFKAHDMPLPAPLNIPKELESFGPMGRGQRRMTYAEFLLDPQLPVFVKPADDAKLFSGGEITQHDTKVLALDMCKPDTVLLVADPVEFISEYRVFVGPNRRIEGMKHYLGDPFVSPNKWLVEQMIHAYENVAPVAYALDVGVLRDGSTVVVECNDFWSLGSYGFDPVRYSELYAMRWMQMVAQARR